MKLTKDTLIIEVLNAYPEAVSVFDKYNMGCVSCLGLSHESLEKGSLMHGIEVELLLTDLHEYIESVEDDK